MEFVNYKGFNILLNYSEKHKMWSWDVNLKGELGFGPAGTREKAEEDARSFIDAHTAPGGPQYDILGRLIKPKR